MHQYLHRFKLISESKHSKASVYDVGSVHRLCSMRSNDIYCSQRTRLYSQINTFRNEPNALSVRKSKIALKMNGGDKQRRQEKGKPTKGKIKMNWYYNNERRMNEKMKHSIDLAGERCGHAFIRTKTNRQTYRSQQLETSQSDNERVLRSK